MNEKNTGTELVVRKSNHLIEASYRFGSINEARVIHLLLTKISAFDKDFKDYEISVAEFVALFNIKATAIHTEIRKVVRKLRTRSISINKPDGGWLELGWLSSAEYLKGKGIIELCFDAKLKPYLLELKSRYTQFNIAEFVSFTNTYAIRFFEFIKENKFKADENGLFKIQFEYVILRKIFLIEEKEYKLFGDFKRYVIEPAIAEINAKTNFAIVVSYGKTGRAITHITFSCTDKDKAKPKATAAEPPKEDKPPSVVVQPAEIKRLVAFGMTDKTAATWLKKYGKEKITRNLDYVDAQLKAGTAINNVKAYLTEAMKNDYGFQTVEEQVATTKEKESNTERKVLEEAAKDFIGKTFVNPLKPEYEYIVNDQNFFSLKTKSNGSSQSIQITQKFLDNIKNGVLIELGK